MKKQDNAINKLLLEEVWDYYVDAMRITDIKGKVINVNKAYCNLTGFDKELLIGKSFKIVYNKNEQLSLQKYYKDFISGGKNSENSIRKTSFKNERKRYLDISYSLLEINNEKYILSNFRDISEHKHALEEIRIREEKYHNLVDSMNEGIGVQDKNGIITFMSKFGCRMLGYEPEELIGMPISLVFDKDNLKIIQKQTLLRRKGKRQSYEVAWQRKDGGKIDTILTPNPIYNKKGELVEDIAVFTDITERKQVIELLQESEERLRITLEETQIGTFDWDIKKDVFYVSPTYYSMLGYKSKEGPADRKEWLDRAHPEDKGLIENKISDVLNGIETQYQYETRIKNAKGFYRWISVIGRTIEKDKKNKPTRIIGVRIDVTEQKQAEEELRKSEENYRNLVDNALVGVYKITFEGDIIFGNEAMMNILEFDGDDYTKLNVKQFYKNPIDREELVRRINEKGEIRNFEVELVSYKGKPLNVIINNKLEGNILSGMLLDITELKKAEALLKKSEERFKQVSENAREWIWEVDKKGLYTYASPIIKKILGYESEEIVNKKYFYDLFIPENREEIKKLAFEVFERKEKFQDLLNSNIHKDGREIILSTSGVPILDNEGNLIGYRGVDIDITERVQAEKTLKESEERFRSVAESATDAIITSNNQGIILSWNKSAEKIFGYNEEEIKGKELSIIMPQRYVEQHNEGIKRIVQGGISHILGKTIELLGIHKNGKEFPLELSLSEWETSSGRFFTGIIRDITDRKRAEDLLKKSEEKFRNLIETMPEGFYCSTPEGYFIDVNPAFVKMLGYESKEDLMKVNIPETLYFSENERNEGLINNPEFVSDAEIYRLKKRDGSEIWIEDFSRYIKDNSGNVIYHEGVMHDITESLRARNAILEAKEKAEEANRMKSSFLANMSHEIRTPLNGILGFSEILKDELKDPALFKFAETIEKSGRRLLETLDLILNFAKLEAERHDINYSNVKIEELIDETIQTFEAMAKAKKLYLKSIIKTENLSTKSDERFLRHILNNLVNNAIKFTNSGGITIELSKENENVLIKVIDTGIGIVKDKQGIIFEEFRQESEGHSRNFEGTGLGLSITKRFVEMMKGKIFLESTQGKGSVFIVELPYKDFSKSINIRLDNKKLEKVKKETVNDNSIKTSILIVEDDEDNRKYIETILSKYKIDSAVEGNEALKKAKEHIYDIILMDINLGKGMDGSAVVQEIRKIDKYKNTPIVALTAYVLSGDKEEFLSVGCSHYLGKPFKKEQLLNLINNITEMNLSEKI